MPKGIDIQGFMPDIDPEMFKKQDDAEPKKDFRPVYEMTLAELEEELESLKSGLKSVSRNVAKIADKGIGNIMETREGGELAKKQDRTEELREEILWRKTRTNEKAA